MDGDGEDGPDPEGGEPFSVITGALPGSRVTVIDENERLKFARHVLAGVAVPSILIFVAYAACPDNTALQQIFELVKVGLLPLVTLVISFYFSKTDG